MKKNFISICLAMVVTFVYLTVSGNVIVEASQSKIETALQWAVSIANDNSHGYSQTNRWGPDYDCSSLVISALKNGGYSTGKATYTGDMKRNLTNNGFTWIPWSSIGGVANLRRGDILLNETYHVGFYLGNNQIVEAHGRSQADKNYDGRNVSVAKTLTGDQDGQEIRVTSYYKYSNGWDGVLRPKETSNVSKPEKVSNFWSDYKTYISPSDLNSPNVTIHWNKSNNATAYIIDAYLINSNGSSYQFMNQINVGNVLTYNMQLRDSGNYRIYLWPINSSGAGEKVMCEFEVKNYSANPTLLSSCTYDGHTYQLYAIKNWGWNKAKQWCESKGGHLATVTSYGEHRAIDKLTTSFSTKKLWLGAKRTNGKFKWCTEENFSDYNNWGKGQPDNANGNEDYLEYTFDDANKLVWNDVPESYSDIQGFIFETESKTVGSQVSKITLKGNFYTYTSGMKVVQDNAVIKIQDNERIEGMALSLQGINGSISYSTHISDVGWTNFVSNGIFSGYKDDIHDIEAIKVKLSGDISEKYNIYYRTNIYDVGWTAWAKNGEACGSVNSGLPVKNIEIMLVPKLKYSVHCADKGWMPKTGDGEGCGTTGQERQVEAMYFQLADNAYGGVKYSVHISDCGWGKYVDDGISAGSTNLGVRGEAYRIQLTGSAANLYDVVYTAHVEDKGWLSCVKNGNISGTIGSAKRLEAIKAKIVPAGWSENGKTLYEHKRTSLKVTFDANGGTCSEKTKEYAYLNTYGVSALPIPHKDGYTFLGWYTQAEGGNKVENKTIIKSEQNITLYAHWKKVVTHEYISIKSVQPTCTKNGYKGYYYCKTCKKYYSDQSYQNEITNIDKWKTTDGLIKATGHKYDSGIVTTKPTCTEKGIKTYTCSVCNATRTESIAAKGHTVVADSAVEPTCTEKGKTEGSHCSVCGIVIKKQEDIDALGHEYKYSINKEATCTEAGGQTWECSRCNAVGTEAIPAKGHTIVTDSAVEPTCTERGKTEGSHCSVCGIVIKEQKEIDALGHDYKIIITGKEATCTKDGIQTFECSRCNAVETKNVLAKGHTIVIDSAVDPTCTEEGKTEGSHCSVCGKVIKEQNELQAKGHTFGEWEEIISPTCNDQGIKKRECSVCSFSETFGIDKSEHKWDTSYTVDKEATCIEDGSKSIHCKICNISKNSEVIPATGHTIVVDSAIEATCTSEGKTEGYHCSKCNEILVVQQTIAVKEHNTDIINKKKSTYFENGYSGDIVCKDCKQLIKSGSLVPKKKLNNIKSFTIKSHKIKQISVKWKKNKNATGYEIRYSTDKNLKKGNKTIKIKNNRICSLIMKKMVSNKKYYVSIRCYKNGSVNGSAKTVYSDWSAYKKVVAK